MHDDVDVLKVLRMQSIDVKEALVLVVEDEERNWFILRDIILFCKGKPIWAKSGMEAIQLIKGNFEIELVFMDINLPFMSGKEAILEVKKLRPELPIVVQTAAGEEHQLQEYKELGSDDCLLKPIDFNLVVDVMKRYLIKDSH